MSKVLSYILPVAAAAIPFAFPATMAALGTALGAGASSSGMLGSALTGAALSGAGSAASGADVGSSLLSAALGGAGGALAGGGGSAISEAAGLSGAGADALSGALTGAAYGGSTGGAEGAALGAIGGGLTGGLTGGADTTTDALSGAGYSLPSSGYASLPETSLVSGGGASSFGGTGMNLSDALKAGSSLYTMYTNQAQQDAINKALAQAQSVISPYTTAGGTAASQLSDALSSGFNYSDYANTPGYEYQLSQGQNALSSALASQGLGQSGASVKAATEYATNLANQNYQDAYNNWLAQNSQLAGLAGTGSTAANTLAGLYNYGGATSANILGANTDATNKLISALLTGSGSIY